MTPAIAPPDATGKLGFYGCAADGRARVVRVAWAGEGNPPRSAVLTCPACGAEHRAALSWRSATKADKGREPEIVLAVAA